MSNPRRDSRARVLAELAGAALKRCKAAVYERGIRNQRQCAKVATRDGYCATHHPEAQARRNAKSLGKGVGE